MSMEKNLCHRIDMRRPDNWIHYDGQSYKIEFDSRYEEEHSHWLSGACDHPNGEKIVLLKRDSIGRASYRGACLRCGYICTESMKHDRAKRLGVSSVTVDEIDTIAESYIAKRKEWLDEIETDAVLREISRRDQENDKRRDEYQQYLKTPKWRAIAAKVMDRANGICEGCLDASASEVHHVSYQHVGNEFAFELLALCRTCHERWHNKGGE